MPMPRPRPAMPRTIFLEQRNEDGTARPLWESNRISPRMARITKVMPHRYDHVSGERCDLFGYLVGVVNTLAPSRLQRVKMIALYVLFVEALAALVTTIDALVRHAPILLVACFCLTILAGYFLIVKD